MGTTMKPVMFFSDAIVIDVHSATKARHVGQGVSIAQFANGAPVAAYKLDNGEWFIRDTFDNFIEGPEVCDD